MERLDKFAETFFTQAEDRFWIVAIAALTAFVAGLVAVA